MSSFVAGWLVLGVLAGTIGGMFGVGGGLVIVPALLLVFRFDQRLALGTSLMAQLLPVAIFAVAEYWRRGEVNLWAGLAIAVGLLLGTWLGARLVGYVPREPMKQLYGAFLVVVGLYFLIAPAGPVAKRDRADRIQEEGRSSTGSTLDQPHLPPDRSS